MNRRRRFRYRLSTLLVATAIVCVLLGYSQWRRAAILRQIEAFKAEGVSLALPDNLASRIWPVVPTQGVFEYSKGTSGAVVVTGHSYTSDEFSVRWDSLCRRLLSAGVDELVLVRDNGDTLIVETMPLIGDRGDPRSYVSTPIGTPSDGGK